MLFFSVASVIQAQYLIINFFTEISELTFMSMVYFIQKLYCISWTVHIIAQITDLILFLEILAACPWSCTCCTSQKQKWLTTHHCNIWDADWSIRMPACAGGYLKIDWQLKRIAVGMTPLRIHFCTWDTTEDPPFCTQISLRIHPFAHITHKIPQFDWLLPAEVVPIKECSSGSWPYITQCFNMCKIILSLFQQIIKMTAMRTEVIA